MIRLTDNHKFKIPHEEETLHVLERCTFISVVRATRHRNTSQQQITNTTIYGYPQIIRTNVYNT